VNDLLLADKLRGLLVGLLTGEALGAAVDGLDRKTILRRHGRLVHMPVGSQPGPRHAEAIAVTTAPSPDRLTAPGAGLHLAVLAGAVAGSRRRAAAMAELATLLRRDDEPTHEAWRLTTAASAVAITADPYAPLPPAQMLGALAEATLTAATRTAVTELRAQVVRPPPPDEALTPFAILPAATASCLLAVQAVLLRARSVEEAVVWAVNPAGRRHVMIDRPCVA